MTKCTYVNVIKMDNGWSSSL